MKPPASWTSASQIPRGYRRSCSSTLHRRSGQSHGRSGVRNLLAPSPPAAEAVGVEASSWQSPGRPSPRNPRRHCGGQSKRSLASAVGPTTKIFPGAIRARGGGTESPRSRSEAIATSNEVIGSPHSPAARPRRRRQSDVRRPAVPAAADLRTSLDAWPASRFTVSDDENSTSNPSSSSRRRCAPGRLTSLE